MKSTSGIALGAVLVCLAFSGTSMGQNASDISGNYGGVWTNGMNAGTGFGAWVITSTNGTNFFSGNFIGNPTNAGITTFGTNAFGFYANPAGSPAFVQADRALLSPLTNGRTFSLRWAINYDSGSGNKGFNLYTGGTNGTQILNINNGDSAAITLNGADVGFGYGTTPMTWTFSQISSNTIRVAANDRDGTGNFATNVTVNGPADSFRIYASGLQAGDAFTDYRQPYFNNFAISNTATGLDTNPPTIALASGVNRVTWVALNGTVNLSTNDVIATDAEGSVSVSISPSTVVTTNNNLTTVTYTATDAAGYRATVSRVVAVGNAAPGYHNLRFPALLTINTSSSNSVYGEIYLDGATPGDGAASGVQVWVGVNSNNSAPATWDTSAWSVANYAGEEGNNDNYQGTISGTNRAPGTYFYATRFRLGTNAANTNFFYGGIGSDGVGGTWGGVRTIQVVSNVVTGGVTNVVTNPVSVTNGNGVLTVEASRLVTYTVDMSVYRKLGTFNPSNHSLQVRTGLGSGAYAERALTNVPGGDFYTGTFPIAGSAGSTNFYKYFWAGTNGLEWEPYAGPTPDRPLSLGANGVSQNAGTNFFGDLAGRRNVTFTVDMSVQKFKGLFNASNHSLQVRTGFDTPGYAERALTNSTGDIYTGTFPIDGADSSTSFFKFYVLGTNGLAWEGGGNREVVLGATGTNQNSGTNFFNNLLESRKISFSVDMSEQVTKLNLNPSLDTVSLLIFTDGFGGPRTMSRVANSSQYTYDLFFDGSMANFPTNFIYKFFNNRPGAPNSGYEGGDDRTLAAGDISPGSLSTTTLALATFVDVPRTTTTFDGWRGTNSPTPELLTQYAFGALTPTNPASRVNLPSGGVSSNQLVLTYYVRGDAQNSNLVVPQTHTNLADTNGWTISGITVSSPLETNNVDGVNVVKRTASVPIDSTNRKFLRLKISE